jgi:hypothetical protein
MVLGCTLGCVGACGNTNPPGAETVDAACIVWLFCGLTPPFEVYISGLAKKAPGFVNIAVGGKSGEAAAAAVIAGFVIIPIY